jgi:hypothetical protein
LWSLAACALLTPIIDWLMPGNRYQWNAAAPAREPIPVIPVKFPAHAVPSAMGHVAERTTVS